MNILVIYFNRWQWRSSVFDHVYSFERYSGERCFYVNTAVRPMPWYVRFIKFDLIIFHSTFTGGRWSRQGFERLQKRVEYLKHLSGTKVVLAQDEFINTQQLCTFVNDFNIDHVFSVAPESEFNKIYADLDFKKVKVWNVLTGYLEDKTVERVLNLAKNTGSRGIDIGYRAWKAEPWLGWLGQLKVSIAEVFQKKSVQHGIKTDISVRKQDTYFEDAWFKFLLNCRYTIGVEGGATVLDYDGSLCDRTRSFQQKHPSATYPEIESACFPGRDGELALFALSPRHLEACLTRTCQILIEGDYNGVLKKNEHYIELKKDFSNIDTVLSTLGDEAQRTKMAEQAFNDIVRSNRYSYREFVRFILQSSCGSEIRRASADSFIDRMCWHYARLSDAVSLRIVDLLACCSKIKSWLSN